MSLGKQNQKKGEAANGRTGDTQDSNLYNSSNQPNNNNDLVLSSIVVM